MRPLILALALVATPALAIDWTLVATSKHGTVRNYVDRDVTHTREAATTLVRVDDSSTGQSHKYLVYVSAAECKRGFGSLHASELGGGPIVKMGGGFTLGEPITIADHVATHLCAPFDY